MASICCSPPESLFARFRARLPRLGNSSKTRGSVHRPVRDWRATSRFSRTVSDAKTRRPCGTSAMPRSTMRKGGQRVTSSPLNPTRPRRGGVKPMIERMSVVLPIPFRPRIVTISPGPTVSVTPWSTWLAP